MLRIWLVAACFALTGCGGGGGGPALVGNPAPGPGPGGGGDQNPPVITNARVSPSTIAAGDQVTISATVTDSASTLASVKANVSYPDQRTAVFQMSNVSGADYQAGFTAFWNEAVQGGDFIITVEATDSAGNRAVSPFIRIPPITASPPPPPI